MCKFIRLNNVLNIILEKNLPNDKGRQLKSVYSLNEIANLMKLKVGQKKSTERKTAIRLYISTLSPAKLKDYTILKNHLIPPSDSELLNWSVYF